MGPIDYSLNIANPMQSVLQGFQIGQQMRQQQLQQQQAEQERQRAFAKREAMARTTRPGATFSDYREVMQQFPEETKGLLEQWNAMDKVDKDLMFNAGGEAFSLLTPGADGQIDPAGAIGKLEEFAVGLENSGAKDKAKQFRDMAAFVKANPTAGKATIGSVLSVWDPERAKGLFTSELGPIDTATVKNLIAEGLKPGTPEFQQAMRQEREKITTTLPGGGFFSGSPDELRKIMGGALPTNVQRGDLPRITTDAEYQKLAPGTYYIDINGKLRTKQGGPSQSATGGFQTGSGR